MGTVHFKSKEIGAVAILELLGDLTGDAGRSATADIESLLGHSHRESLFVNARRLTAIDDAGVNAVILHAKRFKKAAVLPMSSGINSNFNRRVSGVSDKISLLHNECEAAFHFQEDFAKECDEDAALRDERRRFPRIETIFPVYLSWTTEYSRRLRLFGVVRNLSEGGLFVQFIDFSSEHMLQAFLNPYDFQMIDLELQLSEKEQLSVRGKSIHRSCVGDGVGIEFYELSQEHRGKIFGFLERGLKSE